MTHERLVKLAHRFLPTPRQMDDKYSRGVVGFVTGSGDYPGVALLGIGAALATTVGMVRYVGPVRVADLVLLEHPQVVTTDTAVEAGRCQAWVLGSGVLARDLDQARNLETILGSQPLAVVDAGALELADFGALRASNLILTPHTGEAVRLVKRLTGQERTLPRDIDGNRTLALQLQKLTGQTVLLKGSTTVIASETGLLEVGPNSPHLSTAGSGDVLAGLLGGIAASIAGVTAPVWSEIAEFCVLLHSAAAESVAQTQMVNASNIVTELAKLTRKLQEQI